MNSEGQSRAVPRPAMLVVAAALVDPAGRLCMQQRQADRQHGGLWEFPGGKVESGETPAEALQRELAEELDIAVAPEALKPCGFAASAGLVILLYATREWGGHPQCLDAMALQWVAPDALARLPMPPLDYPLADQIAHLLSTGAI